VHVSKSIEPLVGCRADTDSGLHVRKNIEGLFRAAGTVNSSLAGVGTLWEIDAETPALFQRADFPAIYDDPVPAAEVLPGAFSVERDASGSHTDMMPTIGPQILNSDGASAQDGTGKILRRFVTPLPGFRLHDHVSIGGRRRGRLRRVDGSDDERTRSGGRAQAYGCGSRAKKTAILRLDGGGPAEDLPPLDLATRRRVASSNVRPCGKCLCSQ
jgi:hypothetical protein